MSPRNFLRSIVPVFEKEFTYYTHPDVQVTAHQVGTPSEKSWTSLIATMGVIAQPHDNKRFTELERTLTSLYCLFLTEQSEDTYLLFTEAQRQEEKLSYEQYQRLCSDTQTLYDESKEAQEVLCRLITYSDLGKSPVTRSLAQKQGIDSTLDTDDLMLEIVNLPDEKVIEILPSFGAMSASARQLLRQAYPLMTACFGHLYFLEGGAKTLETTAKALINIPESSRRQMLNLVFTAQLFDGIGSQGQLNMAGSVTCNGNFYSGYQAMRQSFYLLEQKLRQNDDIKAAAQAGLQLYLSERSQWIGLKKELFRSEEEYEFILRMACTLRIFDSDLINIFVNEFKQLKPEYQQLLCEQFNLHPEKGINIFARTPHYVATSAMNASRILLAKKEYAAAYRQALKAEICLAKLCHEIAAQYSYFVTYTKMPMSFGKLAFRASEPGFFEPETFDVTLARWALPRPIPSTKIKNIIFDLGHVFIRIDTSCKTVYQAFSQLSNQLGKPITCSEVETIFTEKEVDDFILAFHYGNKTMTEFRLFITEKLGLKQVSDVDFDRAFTASILGDSQEVKARLAYLDQLIDHGYTIYLLSKNNEIHRLHTKAHYDGLHWGRYFFKQYYSNETHTCKPDSAAYLQILNENQLKADETLFLDDIKKYIVSAWKNNIRARQFTVDYPMSCVPDIIHAIDQNEKSGLPITRQSTLMFFTARKFKNLLQRQCEEKSVPTSDERPKCQ